LCIGIESKAYGFSDGRSRGRAFLLVDDAHFTENFPAFFDRADLVVFFENTNPSREQNIHPRVLTAFPDDHLTVLVLPDFAEFKKLANAAGLEALQAWNRQKLLDILDAVLKIP
jgi:hypothetical protein